MPDIVCGSLRHQRAAALYPAVLKFIARIPYSETCSYAWVARKLGKPKAARAVGNARVRNPLPIIIPCHRIARADGTIGAFVLGSEWQKKLLSLEKRYAKSATSRKSPAPVIGPFTVWF